MLQCVLQREYRGFRDVPFQFTTTCVAVRCNVLQCVAVCESVCCSVSLEAFVTCPSSLLPHVLHRVAECVVVYVAVCVAS